MVAALALALAACSSGGAGTAAERGRAAFDKGDIRTARVELMNALQADPANIEARILQARVLIALGNGEGAEAELLRAIQHGEPQERLDPLLAHSRWLRGDLQGVLSTPVAVEGEMGAYSARIRGLAFLGLGDNRSASAEFNRALALAPEDSDVWTDIGRFRRSSGDVAGAIEAIDQALAFKPTNVDALIQRGELTRGQYGLSAAMPWFDRALAIDSGNVTALLERAITQSELGRMSAMLADTRQVLILSPGHAKAWHLLAALAARGHDFELARLLYNRTGGAFDSTPAGMLLSGAIDYGTGNDQQAVRRLSDLVERQPGNRKARRLLAAAQWRSGDAAATAETLRPMAESPDADSYSLALMGRSLAQLGNREDAAVFLARAARPVPSAMTSVRAIDEGEFARLSSAAAERPDDGPLQVRFVSALLARGETGQALALARQVRARNPGAPESGLLLGDALGMAGDFAAAAEQYRRAANLAFNEGTALRLIEALQRSGQSDSAGQVLWLFLKQNPANVPAQHLLAGRAMQSGDWPLAIRLYEQLRRRIGDNDATILNNLAWAHFQSGDSETAIPYARRAWALDRDNPATADTLGWILYASGSDRLEGLVLLSRAARGVPGEADVLVQLRQSGPTRLAGAR